METCEFYTIEDGDSVLAGTIEFGDGHLMAQPVPGNDVLFANILKRPLLVDNASGGRRISPTTDAAAWFKALPNNYTGTYLRVALLTPGAQGVGIQKHDPDQPRDTHGRFGEGGGSEGRAALVDAPTARADWPDHIKALGLPPAWMGVKINPDKNAALLAIGKDSKGRDQYVYSKAFQDSQQAAKFDRVTALQKEFSDIQKQNAANLRSDQAEHAACLSLIMANGVRPGSESDTRAKEHAFGATTLLGQHVKDENGELRLQFTGKDGVKNNILVTDSKVAGMLRERAAAAGAGGQLFPNVTDSSLRDYTRTLDSGDYKTKGFRTLLANRLAQEEIGKHAAPANMKEYKKAVRDVATAVSGKLGNTPTACLQSYIHPAAFSSWKAKI